MPEPIRSIRRSPDERVIRFGPGTHSEGKRLLGVDVIIDGHVEMEEVQCDRLDIGASGKLTCLRAEVRNQTVVAGSMDAEHLGTESLSVTGRLNTERAQARKPCTISVGNGHIEITERAIVHGEFIVKHSESKEGATHASVQERERAGRAAAK